MNSNSSPVADEAQPRERHHAPEPAERLGAAIRTIVLLTVFLMTRWQADRPEGLDFAVGVGAIYVVLSTFPTVWGGRTWRERAIVFTCLDILLVSWLVAASGGMHSEFYMLYYLPVLQAGIRLNLRDAVMASLLAAVCYVFVWAITGLRVEAIQTTTALRMGTFAASAVVLAVLLGLVSREMREERGLRSRSERALNAARAIYELTHALGATLDLSEMMQALVGTSAERLAADAGRALLVQPDTGDLRVASVTGDGESFFDDSPAALRGGIGAWVRECAQPVLVADPGRRPELGGKPVPWPEAAGSWLAAPMLAAGEVVGVVELARRRGASPFESWDLDVLSAVASHAGAAAASAQRHEDVELQAITDPLTGLWNHGEFQVRLSEEIARAQRHGHAASLILVDVDEFRQFNERYGHRAGDEMLRQVAAALRRLLRGTDIAARYGGDDLAIILPETTREGARVAAQNLCEEIKDRLLVIQQVPEGIGVTFSLGVATCPEDGSTAEEIVDAASEAVSAAKAAGGDRVVVHGEEQK